MKRIILIYGLLLAVAAGFLEFLEYKYMMRDLSTEIYILILAISFTSLGIWLGQKLTSTANVESDFEINSSAKDYLGLSDRELEVLEQVAQGLSNKEIADHLYLSINTVKTHLKKVYEKLEVRRRTQAVEKAKSLNLIK
jgi:DNA-binding NarL/FixJ family response regulator